MEARRFPGLHRIFLGEGEEMNLVRVRTEEDLEMYKSQNTVAYGYNGDAILYVAWTRFAEIDALYQDAFWQSNDSGSCFMEKSVDTKAPPLCFYRLAQDVQELFETSLSQVRSHGEESAPFAAQPLQAGKSFRVGEDVTVKIETSTIKQEDQSVVSRSETVFSKTIYTSVRAIADTAQIKILQPDPVREVQGDGVLYVMSKTGCNVNDTSYTIYEN